MYKYLHFIFYPNKSNVIKKSSLNDNNESNDQIRKKILKRTKIITVK